MFNAYLRFAVFVLTLAADAGISRAESCLAVVNMKNDLWLVQADGKPVKQLTSDGQLKFAAAVSRNGQIVAYAGKSSRGVMLIDTEGRLLEQADVDAADAITGLEWFGADILRVEEHLSPHASRYKFLRVPTDVFRGASLLPVPASNGGSCSVSPDWKDTACALGGLISLNNRPVFRVTDPFADAITIQTLQSAIGARVAMSTVPAIDVAVVDVADDTVGMKVTTPNGLWQKQYVPIGGVMQVVLGEGQLYGIKPVLDSHTGIVQLTLVKSVKGVGLVEKGPVWDTRGKRLAFVETNSVGERKLVVIHREMGAAAEDKDGQRGALDGEAILPIEGPISSIEFISETRIKVDGAHQIYEAEIPAQGRIRDWQYSLAASLPKQVGVRVDSATAALDVIGWSCP